LVLRSVTKKLSVSLFFVRHFIVSEFVNVSCVVNVLKQPQKKSFSDSVFL
jgi:hypothetical protein